MDEYATTRLARMVHTGLVEAAIERYSNPKGWGNTGGMVLRANAEKLNQALSGLDTSLTPPYEWKNWEKQQSDD